jgi:phosphatidylglycerophosphatase A
VFGFRRWSEALDSTGCDPWAFVRERWLQLNVENIGDCAALMLGTGLGVGFSRWVPGTVGTLWGLPLVWGLDHLGLSFVIRLLICVVLFIVGVPICARAAQVLGKDDPGAVVFDEIAALPLVFLVIPLSELNVTAMVAGFLWFRLFDITKPWPVRLFDRWHGGLGIMADDTAAALYAAAALWLTVQGLAWLT